MTSPEKKPETGRKRKFGISGFMSLLGSILLLAAFFLPLVNTGSLFNDILPDKLHVIHLAWSIDEDEIPDEDRAQFEAGLEFLEVIGVREYSEDLTRAESDQEREQVVASHALSGVDIARGIWFMYSRSGVFLLDQSEMTTFFWILMGMGWIVIMAGIPGILSLVRRIQPLSAFQVSWNGTYGLILFVGSLLLLIGTNRFEYVSEIRVDYIRASTAMVFIAGAALIWLSAFAGLTRSTWWKAPLIGVFLLAFTTGSFILSGKMILG